MGLTYAYSPRYVLWGGFVGSALARGFADLGWTVVGVDQDFDETIVNHAAEKLLPLLTFFAR